MEAKRFSEAAKVEKISENLHITEHSWQFAFILITYRINYMQNGRDHEKFGCKVRERPSARGVASSFFSWFLHRTYFRALLTINMNIYIHNFSSDTNPKNEVVRSGLKFGCFESHFMVLPAKEFFSFWQIFSDFWWEASSLNKYNLFLFAWSKILLHVFSLVFSVIFQLVVTIFEKNKNLTSIFENQK